MKIKALFKTLTAAAFVTMVFASTDPVSAAVLTFDDVPGGSTQNTFGAINNTYAGFIFGGNNAYNRADWIDTVGSSWNFGAVSGDFTMLNNYGGYITVRDAGGLDFTFDGLYACVWGYDCSSVQPQYQYEWTGYIRGFNNGVEIWTDTVLLTSVWTVFNGHAEAIDELRIDFGNYFYFMVDNLMLNETSAVPVPAAAWLFGSGLLGLIGMARRRKHH